MIKYLITFCLSLVAILSYSQDSTSSSNGLVTEVFFNVSDALGRATGNNNTTTFISDPIAIGLKVRKKDSPRALRFGANFNFVSGDEIGAGFQRVSKDEYYSAALGIEFRKDLAYNFQYYYGVDIRYFNISSTTNAFFNFSTDRFSNVQNGPGVAPLLGFKWNFGKRFALFTEASLNFAMINNYRYVTQNNNKTVLEDKIEYTLRPVAPGAVFLTFQL